MANSLDDLIANLGSTYHYPEAPAPTVNTYFDDIVPGPGRTEGDPNSGTGSPAPPPPPPPGETPCPAGTRRDPLGYCTDCPPGEGRITPNGPCVGGSQQTPANSGSNHPAPASGSGGSGGIRAPAPAPFAYSAQANDFNALLDEMVREGLAAPSRYTPEALQALYGQITRQTSSRISQGERAVRANAAQRGMSRSGQTQAALRGVRDAAETQQGASNVQVQMSKITADYADKIAALDRAQKYLDSLRDSEYRMLIASEQRRQYDANLALSYASLAQQRTLLELTLQSDWAKLNALFGFSLLSQGV